MHTPQTGTPKYIKQILTETEEKTENSTISTGNFNIPFSILDWSFTQKANGITVDLSYISGLNGCNRH